MKTSYWFNKKNFNGFYLKTAFIIILFAISCKEPGTIQKKSARLTLLYYDGIKFRDWVVAHPQEKLMLHFMIDNKGKITLAGYSNNETNNTYDATPSIILDRTDKVYYKKSGSVYLGNLKVSIDDLNTIKKAINDLVPHHPTNIYVLFKPVPVRKDGLDNYHIGYSIYVQTELTPNDTSNGKSGDADPSPPAPHRP